MRQPSPHAHAVRQSCYSLLLTYSAITIVRRCLKPEWGAAVPAGGPWVQAALLALVFFLYGESQSSSTFGFLPVW